MGNQISQFSTKNLTCTICGNSKLGNYKFRTNSPKSVKYPRVSSTEIEYLLQQFPKGPSGDFFKKGAFINYVCKQGKWKSRPNINGTT